MKSLIRVRMSAHDAHYGGGLVDGAKMLQLFGDVAIDVLTAKTVLIGPLHVFGQHSYGCVHAESPD